VTTSPRRSPSIGDVARHAGVSAQTVSRVSTGYPGVRPGTRDRVLAAMRELGYAPNSAARALKRGSFRTLGLVAHQLARTGEARTFEAVVEAARAAGYGVTLVDVQQPTEEDVAEAVDRLTTLAVDGLVVIRAEQGSPGTLALPPQVPVVVSDSRFVGHLPGVATDHAAGTRDAVRHLLDLGHATVTHVGGPEDSLPARERRDAWEAVLREAGRPVPPVLVGDWTSDQGYRHGRALVPQIAAGRVTAVFCANDETALGLFRAVHEAGLRIPQDVSVVGFDDIPQAAYFWPPLTSVAQDFARIGQAVVDLLVEQIAGQDRTDRHVVVPATLVVRGSTGAPPAPHAG
jgi:DNA-binding LacI/PurR family transcriptional regulator